MTLTELSLRWARQRAAVTLHPNPNPKSNPTPTPAPDPDPTPDPNPTPADPQVRKRAIRILDMVVNAAPFFGGESNVFVPRGLLTDKTEVSPYS